MKKNYQTIALTAAIAVPDTIAVAMTQLADELREGLLALAVGTGLQVMDAILEESGTALCGPKGRHDPGRRAVRHGHEKGSVALGERKVPVRRPRVRPIDGSGEVAVPAYEHFSATEVLGEMAMERMLAKLSTRRYQLGLEPVGAAELPPTLARTLRATNAESMIEIARDHSRNVKRWRDGQMALRWCAAGMGEARKQFRRVNGFFHLPALRTALDAHVARSATPVDYNKEDAA